ncbi:GtrA family protein [Acutalibacter sp.]|jgi:putative flippase GtrA|uniref:GtrA family protein n=1 Tax=Acutalibacter sp. TaxID=1918636 RepID=UPI0034E008D9
MGLIKKYCAKYRELILYVVFGVLTTLVNWVSYWLLADLLHVDYMAATFIAQVLSILFAYVTNRRWVFESKVRGVKGVALEMAKFFGARGASLVLDLAAMYLGVTLLRIDDKLMKLISNGIIIAANYVFSKLFVFKKQGPQP